MANEEVIEVNADYLLDQHIGELAEQWEETPPASEEQESIHKQLMEALKVKKDFMEFYDRSCKDKKVSKRENIKFIITTSLQVAGVAVPAILALGMLGFSKTGSYFTGDESKVFTWLYQLANRKL